MARRKNLMTVIRELVQGEIASVFASLLGAAKPKTKNGRRKRRGKWRPGSVGRPPKYAKLKSAQAAPQRKR
jgi:hypothetical protein